MGRGPELVWGPHARLGPSHAFAVRRQDLDVGLWLWPISAWPRGAEGVKSKALRPSTAVPGTLMLRSGFTAHTSNSKHTHLGPKSTSDPSFLAGDVKVIFLKLPLPSSLLHDARILSSCFSLPKPSPLAPTSPHTHCTFRSDHAHFL